MSLYISGPNLPLKLVGPAMVTSPSGKGVIAMGGNNSKAMFELSQSMEWIRLEQTLQIEHFRPPLSIPIPNELVYEQDWKLTFSYPRPPEFKTI